MSKKRGRKNKREALPPRPRKRAQLYQTYQMYIELEELRKKHLLRISAIERGVSNMDKQTEADFVEWINIMLKDLDKAIKAYGSLIPIWDWVTSIKGLASGRQIAKVLAEIDDIGRFDTISKLWKFAGLGVKDGKMDRTTSVRTIEGEDENQRSWNGRLAGQVYVIGELFIKHQTPLYSDVYYEEKARLRRLHPEPEKSRPGSPWPMDYTDSHIHRMAMRKMVKIFMSHLWVVWRKAQGLPVSNPYAGDILGHTGIIDPPTD